MRRRFDARMIQPRWRLLKRDFYGERRGNFDRTHAIAFAVALDSVAIAEKEMCSLLVDAQQYCIACRNFLHVQIAAMRTIVDGQDGAMHRRDTNDTDHRLYGQLEVFVPVYETILDFNDPCLPAELLSPHPIGKHSDAWPQGGEAQIVEFHFSDLDLQHVTDFRPAYFNRSGRTIDERKSDVSLGQLLSEMTDRAVVGGDRAFPNKGFTGLDACDEPVIARKRVFDVADFADTLRHFHS